MKTVSNGLGELGDQVLQYPTGIGVALFGADGWTVKNNDIFGNFKWGVAMFSDPFNEGDDAVSQNNQFIDNEMGRDGTDTNGSYDFWIDGSGTATASRATTARRSHRIRAARPHDGAAVPGLPGPGRPDAGRERHQ